MKNNLKSDFINNNKKVYIYNINYYYDIYTNLKDKIFKFYFSLFLKSMEEEQDLYTKF